tara:strand:+ start:152 stop:580 length:429 start_codon:yes stop_codon:yes gene_type:complete
MRQRRLHNEQRKEWADNWKLHDNHLEIPITLPTPLRSGTMVVTFPANYPFKGPSFSFNGQVWDQIYRTGSIFNDDMVHISNKTCICCDTLMCPNHWHCVHTIAQVVQEFMDIATYKVRVVERFMCKRIQENYLHGVPIHEYL